MRFANACSSIRQSRIALFACVMLPMGVASQAQPRNILLMIGDDHGLEASCFGHPVVRTPNLDRLAAEGVKFTRAFSVVSSCSPSRSVLLSGLYPHQNGHYGLAHAAHKQSALPFVRSLPKLLAEAGYRTGIVGKHHVNPMEQFAFEWNRPGPSNGRGAAEFGELAAEFLRNTGEKPFFLLVGFSDAHRAQRGFGNEAAYRGVRKTRYDPSAVVVPNHLPDLPEVRRDLADYYESVDRLDQGIGRVMEALRQSGKVDETLAIYLSDNGMPFPGAKTNLYDAGIRLPLVARVPGAPKDRTDDALCSWLDIAPTLLEWAGARAPYSLPGRSLVGRLKGTASARPEAVFASHVFHEITMYYPMRAVRTERWKLIWNLAHQLEFPLASDLWESPSWQAIRERKGGRMGARSTRDYLKRPEYELYDLEADPDETRNLARSPAHSGTLANLKARILEMMKATGDPWSIRLREERKPRGDSG